MSRASLRREGRSTLFFCGMTALTSCTHQGFGVFSDIPPIVLRHISKFRYLQCHLICLLYLYIIMYRQLELCRHLYMFYFYRTHAGTISKQHAGTISKHSSVANFMDSLCFTVYTCIIIILYHNCCQLTCRVYTLRENYCH